MGSLVHIARRLFHRIADLLPPTTPRDELIRQYGRPKIELLEEAIRGHAAGSGPIVSAAAKQIAALGGIFGTTDHLELCLLLNAMIDAARNMFRPNTPTAAFDEGVRVMSVLLPKGVINPAWSDQKPPRMDEIFPPEG